MCAFPVATRRVLEIVRAVGFALLVLALAGCARRRPDAESRNVFHFEIGQEVQDLDPHVLTGVPERAVIAALFEGLVAEDESGRGTAPGVATHWETSEDGLRWTFHLRADARWSSGDPVTAHDFVRSYRRLLTPALGAGYAYNLFHLVGAEDYTAGRLADFAQVGAKAIDDRTLLLVLRHRTPFLLDVLKHYTWLPVHLPTLERHGGVTRKGTAWTRPGNLVGNGPFVLESWQPGRKIVVAKSASYWDRDRVKLDEIHFYATEDVAAQEHMFRTGALHRTYELPLAKIPVYRRDRPDVFRQDPHYGVYFYRFNFDRPPLHDARVRRALSLAIDREAIVENVTRGGQQPALNYCPPSARFKSRARIGGDLETARRLLAEAGFPGGHGFPRLEILCNASGSHGTIAEAIQQMWQRNLGVSVIIAQQEWTVYLDALQRKSYDIARGGWIGNYPDPHTFFDVFVTGGGNNMTGFSNADYDRLVADALRAGTEGERMETYHLSDEILARDMPIMPIYFYTRVYALDPTVTGWSPSILDSWSWKYVGLRK